MIPAVSAPAVSVIAAWVFLLSGTIAAEDRPLQAVLERPQLLDQADVTVRTLVGELLASYAPRFWFHSADEGPSDPLDFLRGSSLWFRRPGVPDNLLLDRGRVDPIELVRLWSDSGPARPSDSSTGAGLFLKLDLASRESTRAPAESDWGRAPLLWKLGSWIRDDLLLIEYWFHADQSQGGPFGIGHHQGDWEGVAALVQVNFPTPTTLKPHLVAMYFAAHEGGRWECSENLHWTFDDESQRRPEAFSALGSHATYSKPGRHWNKVLPEYAPRDRHWDSWRQLRPLALEPYFGFSGGWGDAYRWAFMSGPMPPGPFKSMPREPVSQWLPVVESGCATKLTSSSPASE